MSYKCSATTLRSQCGRLTRGTCPTALPVVECAESRLESNSVEGRVSGIRDKGAKDTRIILEGIEFGGNEV